MKHRTLDEKRSNDIKNILRDHGYGKRDGRTLVSEFKSNGSNLEWLRKRLQNQIDNRSSEANRATGVLNEIDLYFKRIEKINSILNN